MCVCVRVCVGLFELAQLTYVKHADILLLF